MAEPEDQNPKWREWFSDLFNDGFPASKSSNIHKLLKEAATRELVDPGTVKIIYGALQVSNMKARDIMIPRANMVFLRDTATAQEALGVFERSPHSRFPVIGEDLKDIKGIVHAKDLLCTLINALPTDSLNLDEIIRSARLIPEAKRLNVLLKDFRSTRQHMAMVVDEFGQVSGLITIEDVLEQIVGEIEDEHDPADDEDLIVDFQNGSFRVKGETPIAEFNEFFGSAVSTDEFDTIGGAVTNQFGYVPTPNETIQLENMTFTVLNSDSRKVELFKLTRTPL